MKQTNNIAIQLTNVSKKYEIHHEKPTLVEKFVKGKNETFWALKNINLTIKKGERVGIIGANGSGKTTLLKIISGITSPTTGTIKTQGRVASLIDLTAGFHPDLTGIQNIYINGLLLNLSKKTVDRHLSSIISFADIRQFIDAPLFTYSSGMTLRLGFAIAVHAHPDLIILDEGLSVGDSIFQKKVKAKIKELFNQHITVVMVSHHIDFLRQYAKRILLVEKGRIRDDGDLSILDKYERRK